MRASSIHLPDFLSQRQRQLPSTPHRRVAPCDAMPGPDAQDLSTAVTQGSLGAGPWDQQLQADLNMHVLGYAASVVEGWLPQTEDVADPDALLHAQIADPVSQRCEGDAEWEQLEWDDLQLHLPHHGSGMTDVLRPDREEVADHCASPRPPKALSETSDPFESAAWSSGPLPLNLAQPVQLPLPGMYDDGTISMEMTEAGQFRLWLEGRRTQLSPGGSRLLALLLANRGRIVPQGPIEDFVGVEPKTLREYLRTFRKWHLDIVNADDGYALVPRAGVPATSAPAFVPQPGPALETAKRPRGLLEAGEAVAMAQAGKTMRISTCRPEPAGNAGHTLMQIANQVQRPKFGIYDDGRIFFYWKVPCPELLIDGYAAHLTPGQAHLLAVLLANRGRIVPRAALEDLTKGSWECVRSYVGALRRLGLAVVTNRNGYGLSEEGMLASARRAS